MPALPALKGHTECGAANRQLQGASQALRPHSRRLMTMPPSNVYRYLLTVVDHFSQWPATLPLRNTTTETVIDNLADGWIAHFGVPSTITSDRGTQFTSTLWAQLILVWAIRHWQITAYHPESNRLVKRFHRRLKESIMALVEDNVTNW